MFFQPLYLQQLGADPVQIGLILGTVGAAMALAHLPAGYFADRFGRRPLMLTAWVMATLSTGMMAIAPTMPLFVLGSALYGLTSFVAGPMNSYITAARGRWSVGRTLTLMSAIYSLGAILGPLVGGWIGKYADLRFNFYLAAGLFVLSTLFVFQIRPQPVESAHTHPPTQALSSVLHPRYVRFLTIIFLAYLMMYLPQPLSQNFLTNERGIDLLQVGQLLAWRSAGIVVLNLLIGQINARHGFLLAQAGMAFFSVLLWQGLGMPWYVAAYFICGSYTTARTMAAAQARALVDAGNMGLAFGVLETTSALTIILAPPLAGLFYSFQPVSVYAASLVGIFTTIAIAWLWMPLKSHQLI